MREIKFRYTVIRENGYVFSEIFTLEQIEKGEVKIWSEMNHVNMDAVKKNQFIDLHDRTGKEIYDADVMLWPDGYKQIIGFNEKHTETSVRDIETSFGYHFDSQHPVDKGNIIGNIHENPELLEAVK